MATGRVPTTANSPLTAKGDLFTYSTAPARLAVGNNGEQIVADSSTSTGLRYQPTQAAGKNYLINGGMDIWQRGTSGFTTGGAYTADRWVAALNAGTFTVSRSTDVPNSPYFNYALSMAGTSAQNMQIFQKIESANSTLFAGQSVTLSLWAKNSAGTSKLSYATTYPTAVDNFASNTTDVTGDFTATSWSSSWTKYSATFTANALATRGYSILLYRNGTETSTTLLTGIQLEIGSVATAFTRTGGTIQGELAACQRYYQRFTASGSTFGFFMVNLFSTSDGYGVMPAIVTLRTTPTLGTTGTASNYRIYQGGFASLSAISLQAGGTNQSLISFSATGSLTNGGGGWIAPDAGNNGYLEYKAEL